MQAINGHVHPIVRQSEWPNLDHLSTIVNIASALPVACRLCSKKPGSPASFATSAPFSIDAKEFPLQAMPQRMGRELVQISPGSVGNSANPVVASSACNDGVTWNKYRDSQCTKEAFVASVAQALLVCRAPGYTIHAEEDRR